MAARGSILYLPRLEGKRSVGRGDPGDRLQSGFSMFVSREVSEELVVHVVVSGKLAEERGPQGDQRVVVGVDEGVDELVCDLEPHEVVDCRVGSDNCPEGACLRLRRERPCRPQIREPLAPLPPYAAWGSTPIGDVCLGSGEGGRVTCLLAVTLGIDRYGASSRRERRFAISHPSAAIKSAPMENCQPFSPDDL